MPIHFRAKSSDRFFSALAAFNQQTCISLCDRQKLRIVLSCETRSCGKSVQLTTRIAKPKDYHQSTNIFNWNFRSHSKLMEIFSSILLFWIESSNEWDHHQCNTTVTDETQKFMTVHEIANMTLLWYCCYWVFMTLTVLLFW
jgi:hypothetical protein